jgi:hypothetical protein
MSTKRLVRADFFPHVGLLQAQLYGFHINSSHFQPAHADWLRRYAVPLLLSGDFRGIIEGTTSQSGSSGYNDRLSLQRATAVYNFLIGTCQVSEEKVLKPFGTGFTLARILHHAREDEHDRAVIVEVVVPADGPEIAGPTTPLYLAKRAEWLGDPLREDWHPSIAEGGAVARLRHLGRAALLLA